LRKKFWEIFHWSGRWTCARWAKKSYRG